MSWLARCAAAFLGGLFGVASPPALAAPPAGARAWVVLPDFETRLLDELRPGAAWTHEVLTSAPTLLCIAEDGCYHVRELQRCSAELTSRCGHPEGTLLLLGARAAPFPPGTLRAEPPPHPPRRAAAAAPRLTPMRNWVGEERENRWGFELTVGGTLGVGLGSSTSPDGTRTPGAWLVTGGMVSIGVRQAHAFRRGLGLDGLVRRLSVLAYLPPFLLGAIPPSAWVGNYVGFDLRVRVLPHAHLLSSSEPPGWPIGQITVGIAPALYVIARERLRYPSVLQMLIPEFGATLPFGPAAGLYLGLHFPGIPFAALLTPRVGIELEPKTLLFFPLDGSPYEAQLLATVSIVVR